MDSTGCSRSSTCRWWLRWSSRCEEEEAKTTSGASGDAPDDANVAPRQDFNLGVSRLQVFSSDTPLPHQYHPVNMDLGASPPGEPIDWLGGITHTCSFKLTRTTSNNQCVCWAVTLCVVFHCSVKNCPPLRIWQIFSDNGATKVALSSSR